MDEFIDELLREERSCDIILPRIQVKYHVSQGQIQDFWKGDSYV